MFVIYEQSTVLLFIVPPRTKYTNNDPYDEAFAVGMFQSDGKYIAE